MGTFTAAIGRHFGRMLAAVALCGAMIGTASAQDKIKAAVIFGVSNPASVNGWDRGHYQGVRKLIDEHGWDVTMAENVPFPLIASTAENYAKSGFQVVIFTSSGQVKAWDQVAPNYPNTLFAMLSTTSSLPKSNNVAAYAPDFYSYGVINGLIAGQATKSNKIAGVAGLPVKAVEDMFSGIIEGAKVVNPNVEFLSAFSGDWTNIPRAREVAALQIQRGADIVLGNAGVGTRGILDASQSGKTKFVGYATDWAVDAPETVLSSVILDVAGWYDALAKDVASGKVEPRINEFGAKTFSVMPLNKEHLTTEEITKIEDSVRRYQAGELSVPVVAHKFK
ncbi:BMP family protein [Aminobacter niigataensis]|uniref:BMP family protein n=1 Tax=Aminobacter niigataensis TaxID=83265 RepID=UPI0022842FC2|nr:BMP family protein [Aminobacter niigataensis]CAI2936635.1 Purine-binding protein [Aminobacter niigataensis]